ncbi:MAG: HEPN domain-containing protein [Elusimicrobia bacterium]|nr:HEPN domain-containing protein [Candidatus Liberimonas magnetica]
MDKKVNIEFQKGLEKKRIVHFAEAMNSVDIEIQSAKDDLSEASDRFSNKKYKYATITAYYSMFHSSRALVYSKGYREKSHYYLLVAIKALFVEKGEIPENLLNEFHEAMVLRENADYSAQFSKEGAEAAISTAKDFLHLSAKILGKK